MYIALVILMMGLIGGCAGDEAGGPAPVVVSEVQPAPTPEEPKSDDEEKPDVPDFIDEEAEHAAAELAIAAVTGWPYKLVYWDEFSGTAINTTKWRKVDQELNANGAVCHYNPAMVSVVNGFAVLQVQKIPWRGRAYSCGQLDTLNRKTFTYGYFETKIKVPKGSGLHASFWLWPDNNIWPPELDVVEIRGDRITEASVAVHWPDPVYEGNYHPFAQFTFPTADLSAGVHKFAMYWTREKLQWIIDDVSVKVDKDPKHIPRTPMRLEVDLALDQYAGGVNATTVLPAKMLVDYVRVFQQL